MSPKRIQRKRTKGWRMPPDAVYVGRPTQWGNPVRLVRREDGIWELRDSDAAVHIVWGDYALKDQARREAVKVYREEYAPHLWHIDDLRGKDLACWCPLEDAEGNRVPCHADVLLELANPHKAAPFERVTHRFYLATPAGLVRDDDPIPAHWGLLEVTGSGCRKVREAQRREPEPMPEGALVEAFRRAARAEARIRSASADDPAARVVDLARQAATATEAADRARAAASRDRERLNGWLRLVAEAGGVPCVCGARLARSLGASYYGEHKHADGSGCTANRWGTAQVDVEALAKALGLPELIEEAA